MPWLSPSERTVLIRGLVRTLLFLGAFVVIVIAIDRLA